MSQAIEAQKPNSDLIAHSQNSDIPNTIQQLKVLKGAGGLTDKGEAEFQEYVRKHPDYFPEGTPIDKQKKVFQSIKAKQRIVEEEKIQASRKLDETVVQLQKERETEDIAKKTYESGHFLKYCKENFAKVWFGDVHILEGVLYTAANMRVLNAKDGIHLHIMGTTQAGKSDSVKAAMQFIHPDDRLIKTFSMKYLFYAAEELHPNTIVFSDDTVFEPETASLYRNMLTSWHTGVNRGTVVNHTKKDLHIPPRVSLILTSVESVVLETDDGQDESRFLTLEVRRTPEQMAAIREFIQEDPQDIKPCLDLIYTIWASITPRNVKIHKTVEKDIPIREFKRYLTLVQAHALLCNRATTTDEDFDAIDKFLTYSKPMIDSTTPAYSRKESAVLGCLSTTPKPVAQLETEAKMSIQDVYRAIRGREGTFQKPKGGLMLKERRLRHEERRTDWENNTHMFWLEL